jgi:hypothetical protein
MQRKIASAPDAETALVAAFDGYRSSLRHVPDARREAQVAEMTRQLADRAESNNRQADADAMSRKSRDGYRS